jgi:selenocysteine lyase/cysteine desulfurase
MPPVTDEAIESLRQTEFTVTREWAYLDHATFGPLPASHVRAAAETLERAERKGSLGLGGTELLDSVRAEAATLLHCAPGSVYLPRSTSEGLGLLAQGLDWQPGDEIVVHRQEFEGCLAPFLNLADRGALVRVAGAPDEIESLLGDATRAVCLSVVDRATGVRAPVEAIAAACRARGIWLALDAAQAMGVLPLDAPASGADIVSAHGYKYLFSGFGLAPTYCSERAIAELRVPQAGWKNARVGRESDGLSLAFGEAASRYEPTMSSLAVLAGMRESLRLLNALDDAGRERRALAAAEAIASGLRSRGYELLGSAGTGPRSAIVSARHPSFRADDLVGKLRAAHVVAASVDDALRLSTHLYTTSGDVEALLAALPNG